MILVFADDSTVSVYENEGQVNVDCEGIDVENGVYTFLNERGYLLKPVFPERNQKLFGKWTISDRLQLQISTERNEQLLRDFLEDRIFFEKGTKEIRSGEQLKELILNANPDLKKQNGG